MASGSQAGGWFFFTHSSWHEEAPARVVSRWSGAGSLESLSGALRPMYLHQHISEGMVGGHMSKTISTRLGP